MLDPDHLQNFLLVLELGSLSKAASRAHLTQPALSRQIRLLEESLHCSLFERTGRGMRATEAGHRLEKRARPLLAQWDSLPQDFGNGPLRGSLTLAVTPNVGMSWAAQCVRAFRRSHPKVALRVVVVLGGAMAEQIANGRLDLGVLYTPIAPLGLVTTALWQEEVYFICRKTQQWSHRAHVSCRQVLQAPMILPSSRYGARAMMEEQASALGIPLNLEMEVDSMRLALELVRQGTGHILLTARALPDIRSLPLLALPIRRPTLIRSAQLSATERSLQRPVVRALWECVQAQRDGSED